MATDPRRKASAQMLDRVRSHAYATLTPQTAAVHHLGVVPRILRKGETLKLVDRRIKVPEDAVLVFEDQMPGANFGHPCRYLFHSPKDGSLLHTVEAMFPPEVADVALLPQYFHEPLAQAEARSNIYAKFDWSKVARYPWLVDDNRFALLWTSQTATAATSRTPSSRIASCATSSGSRPRRSTCSATTAASIRPTSMART
jgi:hypothetical protein